MDSVSSVLLIENLIKKDEFSFTYGQKKEFVICKDKEFVIPKYQREFSWPLERVDNLIDDIFKSHKFLGIIYLNQVENEKYEVIDGQQRLSVLWMIVNKLNQLAINNEDVEEIIDLTGFKNHSFIKFNECISNNFTNSLNENDDVLKQFDDFKAVWEELSKKFDELDYERVCLFRNHLLSCEINVLISTKEVSRENKKICVDYFIDINNKGIPLDKTDILRAYMFRENFDAAIIKWNSLQTNMYNLLDYKYKLEHIFLHYFLCFSNSKLGTTVIKGISDEYKITNKCKIKGKEYQINTNIEEIIGENAVFYKNMLATCLDFVKYMKVVVTSGDYTASEFKKYFEKFDYDIDSNTKSNIYTISNDIICCPDNVPKVLLFKYFTEILNNKNSQSKDIKIIYYLNVLATIFSVSNSNSKSTNAFASLMLDKDWIEKTKKRAYDHFKALKTRLGYTKEIKDSFNSQYLSRRLHALVHAYSYNDNQITFNEAEYQRFRVSNNGFNDEHFIINQKGKICFKFKGNNEFTSVVYPNKIFKKFGYLSNIIRISETINSNLGSKTIKDKILYLESLSERERNDAFQDELSKKMYSYAVAVFKDSNCPSTEELSLLENKEAAIAKVKQYFDEEFEKDFKIYVEYFKEHTW